MEKPELPSFSRKRMKLLLIGVALIAVAVCALVYAQSLTSIGLTNTGSIKPPVSSAESPLMMVRDDSVFVAMQQGNNESALVPVTEIPWGAMWDGSDSFHALNLTCIDLYNTNDAPIYPAWTVDKLPTGCTLTALVCVQQDYYYGDGSGIHANPPTFKGGFVWAKNDFNAFYMPAKDMAKTFFYKIVFVLTLSSGAIPQMLNFVITINCQE
jgi:hypothetical protein